MATYTTNLNLKKPDYEDLADIADINANMDVIDEVIQTEITNRANADNTLAQEISTKATKVVYTATISTTWSGTSAPFTKSVYISGITANDNPHITPVYSTTNATAILQKTAWGLIGKGITGTNIITFTCFETKPTTAIPIKVEVIR